MAAKNGVNIGVAKLVSAANEKRRKAAKTSASKMKMALENGIKAKINGERNGVAKMAAAA